MTKYYHTSIKRRLLHSNPNEVKPVAELVFEAEDPNTATLSLLDAVDALGVPRSDSGTLQEFGEISRLDSFPFGLDSEKPDWSDERVKVWLISPTNNT